MHSSFKLNDDKNSKVVFTGLLTNVLLAAVKFISGIVGNSYALIADSIESLVDVLGSMVIFGGLRISRQAANDEFPYGLGKAEGLAALVVGIIVVLAAIGITIVAIVEIFIPHHSPEPFTLVILVLVVITKEILQYRSKKAAAKSGSPAMSADAFHHRSDSITSLAAAVGISIAIWGGENWASADDWAALVAAGIIFYNGKSMIKRASLHLLDQSAPAETIDNIRNSALSVKDVIDIEKLFVRVSGTNLFVDIHVHAAADTKLSDAHRIGGIVKSTIMNRNPEVAGVLVHMEPADD